MTMHEPAVLVGGTIPAHVPGAYPSLSCCGGTKVRLVRQHARPLTEDERRELDDAAQIAAEHDAGYHARPRGLPVAACLRCSPEMSPEPAPPGLWLRAREMAAEMAMDASESGDPIMGAGILNAPVTAAELGCTHERADLCERAGEHVAPAPPPILTAEEMAASDRETLHAAAGILRRRFPMTDAAQGYSVELDNLADLIPER